MKYIFNYDFNGRKQVGSNMNLLINNKTNYLINYLIRYQKKKTEEKKKKSLKKLIVIESIIVIIVPLRVHFEICILFYHSKTTK